MRIAIWIVALLAIAAAPAAWAEDEDEARCVSACVETEKQCLAACAASDDKDDCIEDCSEAGEECRDECD